MQVLESRFDLNDERVWFGKAKLLADRIVLKGIGYYRKIDLADIVEVRWAASELVIVLQDGDEIDMTIKAAALWKYELQARCGLRDAGSAGAAAGGLQAALPPEPERDASLDDVEGELKPPETESLGTGSAEAGSPDRAASESMGDEPMRRDEEQASEQTEMFLQRESTYRIRNGFAEDRPQQPKRSEDQPGD